MMCKDQEYVKNYTYDLNQSRAIPMRVFNFDSL